MPDLTQLVLLLALGGIAAIVVSLPLIRGGDAPVAGDHGSEHEALELRYRVALEAVRDVEADRRAGSLDDAGYAAQRAEAEQAAARALAELEAAGEPTATVDAPATTAGAPRPRTVATRALGIFGAALAALVVIGFFVPAPIGLANPLVDTRQQAIDAALARLQDDPRDTQALSNLANVYAAGTTYRDMQRAASALIALITLEPDNVDAYNRLITVYIRVADWKDATATTDGLAKIAPDSVDVPFFRGLIALQGSNDVATARQEFEKFEKLAPDDPRVEMVRALLEQASSGSSSPSP